MQLHVWTRGQTWIPPAGSHVLRSRRIVQYSLLDTTVSTLPIRTLTSIVVFRGRRLDADLTDDTVKDTVKCGQQGGGSNRGKRARGLPRRDDLTIFLYGSIVKSYLPLSLPLPTMGSDQSSRVNDNQALAEKLAVSMPEDVGGRESTLKAGAEPVVAMIEGEAKIELVYVSEDDSTEVSSEEEEDEGYEEDEDDDEEEDEGKRGETVAVVACDVMVCLLVCLFVCLMIFGCSPCDCIRMHVHVWYRVGRAHAHLG
jgi:hypothetical protein